MDQIRNEWRYGDQDQIKVQVTANMIAGDVLAVGTNVIGILLCDALTGELANIATSGVWEMMRTSSSTQLTAGAVAYWDSTNKVVTTTAGSNLFLGVIVPSITPTNTTCYVQLRKRALAVT